MTREHWLAEAGYRSYACAMGNRTARGLTMPIWDELPPEEHAAWQHAAAAIRRRVVLHALTADEPEVPDAERE